MTGHADLWIALGVIFGASLGWPWLLGMALWCGRQCDRVVQAVRPQTPGTPASDLLGVVSAVAIIAVIIFVMVSPALDPLRLEGPPW